METLLCLVAIGLIIFCYKAAKDVPVDPVQIKKKKSTNNSLIEGMVIGEMISPNNHENTKTELDPDFVEDLDSDEFFEDY